jgi:integrase/recombinase XerC
VEFDGFLTYLRTEKRGSVHTSESYGNDLLQFAAFCEQQFGIVAANEVSQSIVRSWMAYLMDEEYKASSVHRKLSSVHAYFKFLAKTGLSTSNPARGIPKPKLPGRLPVFVDEKGAKALYSLQSKDNETTGNSGPMEFSEKRDLLIVTLLYETGIRRAELLQLTDHDIDFYKGQIKVLGKRNKMRFVPIGKDMMTRIRSYQQLRNNQKFSLTTDNLIVGDSGKKISKTFVYLKVKSYLSQVSTIQRKSPHVLRHTFATHMLNNGADLNVIKEILGHSSLAATQVYTHNSIEKLKSIHKKMHPRNN